MSGNAHLLKPNLNQSKLIDVTPESAGWEYLSFCVIRLKAGETYSENSFGNELALVPLQGKAEWVAGDNH